MENENYEEMQLEELQALQAIYMDDYSDFTKVFFKLLLSSDMGKIHKNGFSSINHLI